MSGGHIPGPCDNDEGGGEGLTAGATPFPLQGSDLHTAIGD